MTTPELRPLGVWAHESLLDPDLARDLEGYGYGAVWLGGSPAADLGTVEPLLAATENLVVATGIVNIWTADASEVAASHRRITAAHPGRFLLGSGSGTPRRTRTTAARTRRSSATWTSSTPRAFRRTSGCWPR